MILAFAKGSTPIRLDLRPLIAFTVVVNLLILVQPLYMLQVYDRVLSSGSFETLLFLSLIAALAHGLLGAIDSIRSAICSRLAQRVAAHFGGDVLVAAMKGPKASLGDVQILRDLATVRSFVSGRLLLSLLDLPFVPVFIALLFLLHPHLFWITIVGAAVLAALTVLNERAVKTESAAAGEAAQSAMMTAQTFARNGESLFAMGMTRDALTAWGRDELVGLERHGKLDMVNAMYAGVSRMLRMNLQIGILGYGAYLVLQHEMSGGMIFVASLLSGRALQPIDQLIASWKPLLEVRRAFAKLSAALAGSQASDRTTDLGEPVGAVDVEDLVVVQDRTAILRRISFSVEAGECVVVVGPSGAGKSTLMRALVGAADLQGGTIRIDGSELRNWNRDRLGRRVGYLAQDIDLLPGTISQNIARFRADARDEDILDAARKAQVHELIQALPNGYDTLVGPGGTRLSGGQRQRIGLARAFFGEPRLLVLDEPNANLDSEGDAALDRAVAMARRNRVTVFIVTQRRQIADRADKILVLSEGRVEDFGPRDEVIGRRLPEGARGPAARADRPAAAGSGNDAAGAPVHSVRAS